MGYHYESHTTTTMGRDGSTQSSSSVFVRELDDGEVGILMAGNNSILDPSLTPRMLTSPTTNYDVESDALPPSPDDDDDYDSDNVDATTTTTDEEETWFPALRHNSWIQGLDGDDIEANMDNSDMVGKMMETLFATDVLEKEEEEDDSGRGRKNGGDRRRLAEYSRRPNKSRRTTTRSSSSQGQRPASDRNDGDDDGDEEDSLVPVDIICVMLND